jgi:hypothetical protein
MNDALKKLADYLRKMKQQFISKMKSTCLRMLHQKKLIR